MSPRTLFWKIGLLILVASILLQPDLIGLAARSGFQSSLDTDPEFGPEFQVSAQAGQTSIGEEYPAAAFNSREKRYLVVWENLGASHREIHGQLVSQDGQLIGNPIVIAAGSSDQIRPCVAYNDIQSEFMVLWMDDASGNGSRYEIRGQRITKDGELNGVPFPVEQSSNSLWSPRLAWSGATHLYMVVWSARKSSSIPFEIGMKMLYADGSIAALGTLSGDNVRPIQPDITYNPVDHRFLVVWSQTNNDNSSSLMGDLREANGNRVKADAFQIYYQFQRKLLNPRTAFVKNPIGLFFAVVFELEITSADHDVYLSLIDRAAYYSPSTFPIAQDVVDEVSPQVAADRDRTDFLILYQRGVSASQLWLYPYPFGSYSEPEYLLCSRDSGSCSQPAMTWGPSNLLVIYAGSGPEGPLNIYGRNSGTQSIFLPVILKD